MSRAVLRQAQEPPAPLLVLIHVHRVLVVIFAVEVDLDIDVVLGAVDDDGAVLGRGFSVS